MKIILWDILPYHYEVYGWFIEHFLSKKYEISLYINTEDPLKWIPYYNEHFKIELDVHSFEDMNEEVMENCDRLITMTNELTFPKELLKYQYKLISYDHYDIPEGLVINKHINIRPFKDSNKSHIYPIFRGINMEEKKKLLDSEKNINICLIGKTGNIDCIKSINNGVFSNNIKLYYISRSISLMDKFNLSAMFPNMEVIINCDTSKMIDIVKKSQYILLSDSEYYLNHISGCIGLSFSYGCRLILPKKLNSEYNFKSCLYYEDFPILEKFNSELEFFDIQEIFNERYKILESNFKTSLNIF